MLLANLAYKKFIYYSQTNMAQKEHEAAGAISKEVDDDDDDDKRLYECARKYEIIVKQVSTSCLACKYHRCVWMTLFIVQNSL